MKFFKNKWFWIILGVVIIGAIFMFKNGKNIYFCYGLARAFSKRFYTKIKFPLSKLKLTLPDKDSAFLIF